jgi:hypothetical protein
MVVPKLVAASVAPPVGLTATYWANVDSRGVPERSTDFPHLAGATRIDPALDFQGPAFPVHFFNDAERFNLPADASPARDQLPFSVLWQGWLRVPRDGPRRFVLESAGPAHVQLDGAEVLGLETRDIAARIESGLSLSAGLHELEVRYTRPEGRVPLLRLSWQAELDGPLEPVGGGAVRWLASEADLGLPRVLAALADVGIALAIGAWCVLGLRRLARTPQPGSLARAGVGTLPIVFLLQGMLLHSFVVNSATILSGRDDWLVYESLARDILLNGPLMTNGQDHAAAFYGQPLYPYVLALAHRLTGESLFGPLALQFAALGGLLVLAAVLARRVFGVGSAALAGLAFFWVFIQQEHFRVARQLFNENLYMPLVAASLVVLVPLAQRRTPPVWWRALAVGMLLGLTVLSRSQFLVFLPLAGFVLGLAWRGTPSRRSARALGLMLIGVCLTIAPATLRNWWVTPKHDFVLVSSSGGYSLLEFHRPPPGLIDPATIKADPVFSFLHLDEPTRTVIAFARQDPLGYLAALLPLGAHSIGLPGARLGSIGVQWGVLLAFALYVAAFAIPRVRRRHVWLLHTFVLSHLALMMLFEADTYGYRLVLPMYLPIVVVAAQVPLALIRYMARFVYRFHDNARRVAQRATVSLAGLVAAGAALQQGVTLAQALPERELAFNGLPGAAGHAALTAERVRADVIYFAARDGTPRTFGTGHLPGLRYPRFKWFDPATSLPMPASEARAVYTLAEIADEVSADPLVGCLGAVGQDGERVLTGREVRQRCLASWPALTTLDARFGDIVNVEAVSIPPAAQAGDRLTGWLIWHPLVAHAAAQQVSLHVEQVGADPSDPVWGNGTEPLYPAAEWEPGETIISRVPIATDGAAIPDMYRLTLGIAPTTKGSVPLTAVVGGSSVDRLPVGMLTLQPSAREDLALDVPSDMQTVQGSIASGGLQLVAARAPRREVHPGERVSIGLLWRALRDAPQAAAYRVRLVLDSGEIVQQALIPMFGGRFAPGKLRVGQAARDEAKLVIAPRVPRASLKLDLDLVDAGGTPLDIGQAEDVELGTLRVAGPTRVLQTLSVPNDALPAFGHRMQLLDQAVEPTRPAPGSTVQVRLRWQCLSEMTLPYKVFVHVLDPSGERVIAQRDAEPQSGEAPTTGWLPGDAFDDAYDIALPAELAPGQYPIELGVYDERSGERLRLATGENRLLLSTPLEIR